MVIKLPGFEIFLASSIKVFFQPPTLVDKNFFCQGPLFSIHTRKLGRLVHLNELYYPKGTIISPSQILICVLSLQLCLKWKEWIFEFKKIQKKLKKKYWVRWKLIWKCWKLQVMKEKHCQKLNPSHSFPFSQWFNTFTKITENGITAIVLEFTFKFHFLAFTTNRYEWMNLWMLPN